MDPFLLTPAGGLISPDGELWKVPFGALLLGKKRFVIEQYRISYLVSGRALLPRTEDAVTADTKTGGARAPVIMADPDFDLSADQVAGQTQRALESLALRKKVAPSDEPKMLAMAGPSAGRIVRGGTIGAWIKSNRFARLPGTAEEAKTVAPFLKRFAQTDPLVFVGPQALEGVCLGGDQRPLGLHKI